MRTAIVSQLQLGEIDIATIKIDPCSRDDIPQLLRGLQYLYYDDTLRKEVFQILEKLSPQKISTEMGRSGMMWWKIFVMGALRLNLNGDYGLQTVESAGKGKGASFKLKILNHGCSVNFSR